MRFQFPLGGIFGVTRLAIALVLIIYGLIVTIIHSHYPNQDRQRRFKMSWSAKVLRALGIKLHSVGNAPVFSALTKGELIAANHITFIDIFVINAISPSTFVSKSDVTNWPIIGMMARLAGTIFLDRGSRRAAHRTQEQIVEALLGGENIALFPEGTTTDGTSLLPFHGALFQAAIDANATVRCASIRYLDDTNRLTTSPAYVGDISLASCLWNIATSPTLQASIEWAPAIEPPHQDRRHLAKHAHRVIAHRLANDPKTPHSPKITPVD